MATPALKSRAPSRRGQALAARFWMRVERRGPTECWPWIGYTDRQDYGRFVHQGQTLGAHKVALELKLGRQLAAAEVTRHKCHTPRCCNPAHLEVGTRADNNADMNAAGRRARGEQMGNHRLTDEMVVEIRERYAAGETALVLAQEFGVSDRMIGKVAHAEKWAHIGGPISPRRKVRQVDPERSARILASLSSGEVGR